MDERVDEVDGPGDEDLLYLCGSGQHDLCVHVLGDPGFLLLTGTSIMEFDLDQSKLCPCPCHLDCPMVDQTDAAGWPERCEFPATLAALDLSHDRQEDRPDLFAMIRESRDKSRRTRRARAAVGARTAGLDREGIAAMIDVEWSRHGLEPPVEPLRGMEIDRVVRKGSKRLDGARLNVDLGLALLKAPFRIAAMLRKTTSASRENDQDRYADEHQSTYRVRTRADSVEVVLDDGTQARLSGFGADGLFAPSVLRSGDVELRLGAHGVLEVWEFGAGPADESQIRRLGTVREGDAGPYRRPVAAAARVGQVAVCTAMRSSTAEGRFRLHLMGRMTR
jgi:hypothetical protein